MSINGFIASLLFLGASSTTPTSEAFQAPCFSSSITATATAAQRTTGISAYSHIRGRSHIGKCTSCRGATTALSMTKHTSKTTTKKHKSNRSGGGSGFGGDASKFSKESSITVDDAIDILPRPSWAERFAYAGAVRPGRQSPQRHVALSTGGSSQPPDYAKDGQPKKGRKMLPWQIEVKTADQIVKMRASGALARHVLDTAGRAVRPGITTDAIDRLVHAEIVKAGAYPSPLNYHGFPKSCCSSVNEVICHGIPDDRPLVEGDIINLDITVYLDGFHGDCSEMFYVTGDNSLPDAATKALLQTTYDSWISACNSVHTGMDYKAIGAIIEDYVEDQGFSTVHNICGHGIGAVFHDTPDIFHHRNSHHNGQMAVGHTFTIEPMICEGSADTLHWPDDWTITTVDGTRSAQFEHTLLITADGVEALTGKTETSPVQFWELESKIHKGVWLGTSKNATARMDDINADCVTIDPASSQRAKQQHEQQQYTGSKCTLSQDDDLQTAVATRRSIFQQAFVGLLASGSAAMTPLPSWALKERNEPLCATGFFTNFLEYRCTDIGDISDEGQRTSFSTSEEGAADSLLNKLNLEMPATSDDEKEGINKPVNKQTQQRDKVEEANK